MKCPRPCEWGGGETAYCSRLRGEGRPGVASRTGPLSRPQCCGSDPRPGLRGSRPPPAARGARLPRYCCPFLVRNAGHRRPPLRSRALPWASSSHLEGQGCVEAVCSLPSTSQTHIWREKGSGRCVPLSQSVPGHIRREKWSGRCVPPLSWIERGFGKCVPLSAAQPRSHLERRAVWKVSSPPWHIHAHIWMEGRSGRCVPPSPVHQSPWQGIELDGSSPFQPKPFHGENPALLHDPRRFLGAALGVWGAPLADSWSPTAPASSSLGMTRRCP